MNSGYDTPVPPSLSHPLFVYLAADGNIWAVNSADGRGYCIGVANSDPGVNTAPSDGQTYVQQGSDWVPVSIPAQGVVINSVVPGSAVEGTSVTLDVYGTGFSPASVLTWAGYNVPTTFVDAGHIQGQLNLGPGSAGRYSIVVIDGDNQSNSLGFLVNPTSVKLTESSAACTLDINADGDVIITQQSGPNAGKSVNLTYAKWT